MRVLFSTGFAMARAEVEGQRRERSFRSHPDHNPTPTFGAEEWGVVRLVGLLGGIDESLGWKCKFTFDYYRRYKLRHSFLPS